MQNPPLTYDANYASSMSEVIARPFGSDFAGQSRAYLLIMPLLLTITGLVTWAMPSNETFVLGAVVGGLTSVYMLVDVVFRSAPLRLSSLLAMTLLIAYNLTSLNSWLTLPRGGLTIAEYFTRDPGSLARATGASMFTAALLLALGQLYERPVFGQEFRIKFTGGSVVLICLSTALILGGYLSGQLTFMGITLGEEGRINPLAAIIIWWAPPAFAYSICATLNTTGTTRLLVGACSLIQCVTMIPMGRRVFTFGIILAMITARLGKFRSKMSTFKKLIVGAVGMAVVVVASMAFLYLRVAVWGHKGTHTLSDRIRLALSITNSRTPSEVLQMLRENASTRGFDLSYLADLIDASSRSTPLMGQDLLHNLQLMVPSAISPSKFGMSPYGEEEMVDMRWGFGYNDEPNSLLTAGAADFGIIGVFLYPLLAVLLLRVTLEWMQSVMPTYGAALIGLAFIYEMLLAEQLPAGYLLQIRNSLIIMAAMYVVSIMPRFRLRGAEHG